MRTQFISEDYQMLFWHPDYGISQSNHWPRSSSYGSHQILCDIFLETPHISQRHLLLPWFCQLLLQIHPQLLKHHHSSHCSYPERYHLVLDVTSPMILQHSQSNLCHIPCPHHPGHLPSIPYHVWHLSACCQCCPYAKRHKWWSPSMCLLL